MQCFKPSSFPIRPPNCEYIITWTDQQSPSVPLFRKVMLHGVAKSNDTFFTASVPPPPKRSGNNIT